MDELLVKLEMIEAYVDALETRIKDIQSQRCEEIKEVEEMLPPPTDINTKRRRA